MCLVHLHTHNYDCLLDASVYWFVNKHGAPPPPSRTTLLTCLFPMHILLVGSVLALRPFGLGVSHDSSWSTDRNALLSHTQARWH
jgi:hypothetical protein